MLKSEDEGRSTDRESVSGEEPASKRANKKLKGEAKALMEMIDDKPYTGMSGVMLGLPGDDKIPIKPSDLTEDKVP